MSINFTSKLIVDKNIKSLKKTDINELETKLKKYVEAPVLTDVLGDDIYLKNLKNAKYDGLLVKYGEIDIPFDVENITYEMVLDRIFSIVCYKNGLKVSTVKSRIEFIRNMIEERIKP